MSTRYIAPTVESIIEDSEDESREDVRGTEKEFNNSNTNRQHRPYHDSTMSSTKSNSGRERERLRRMHKSTSSSSRHNAQKSRTKNTNVKRASGSSTRESDMEEPHLRHRHTRHSSSPSSSSDDEEQVLDHKAVLAASRARLTSPSVISNLTCLTSTTNKSSSSSGSNSTVTQDSMSRRSTSGKAPETKDSTSPPVPSPPNVFAYLQKDSDEDEEDEQQEEQMEQQTEQADPDRWSINPAEEDFNNLSLPAQNTQDQTSASSVSSSLHSDGFSEPAIDFDTDRSTSPERSVYGREDSPKLTSIRDTTSMKIATQMAAANQRQDYYGAAPSFGTPSMQRSTDINLNPLSPSSELTPRNPYPPNQYFPRADKLPVTGYELLASKLSDHSGSDTVVEDKIKPMYRKFEALNHRILLHLQDEISELEEQLHRLDAADTEARRTYTEILPASRRAAEQMGGELQWHKIDILGRIGYKLAQYNQTLTSFHATQNLSAPSPHDISHYRAYLQTMQPIAEVETRFLDPTDDLVSVCSNSDKHSSSASYLDSSSMSSTSHDHESMPISRTPTHTTVDETDAQEYTKELSQREDEQEQEENPFPTLAIAIAVSILIPIMTFSVIPTFLGRMTVVCLVASGVVGALMQSGKVKMEEMVKREGLLAGGVYAGSMLFLAAAVI